MNLRLKTFGSVCFYILCNIFFSCNNQAIYDRYQSIENTSWEKNKEYYFTFQIKDITVPYDLTLEVRNNNKYPYQNLWIFCSEEHPFGPIKRDTIECTLADEFGKWSGQGISIYHSSFSIKKHYYFPIKGQYTLSFRQGMRNNDLKGIQEIGLKIKRSSSSVLYEKHLSEEK